MKTILAIDPGSEQSAFLIWENNEIIDKDIIKNDWIITLLKNIDDEDIVLVIEMFASYGMPVGRTVFETCVWIGRFIQTWEGKHELVYRKDIKMHLCHTVRAKDSNVRQALIDKYGKPGTKKEPGFTYGVSKDIWSALAIATYYNERGAL